MSENVGRAFQKASSYERERLEQEERTLDWRSRPPAYKFYTHVPVISLPSPSPGPDEPPLPDLLTCVARRRSLRSFAAAPLSLLELSRLLWASAGITARFTTPYGQDFYRAAPAAGALYPIETYLVASKVENLEPGLYHYRVAGADMLERPIAEGSHSLEQLQTGDLRAAVAAAALDQPFMARAAVVFLWTAVFARSEWKYRERAYRYVYLDAGHMAAHLALTAVALGLGSCPVAAFYDQEANALLGIDGTTEGVVYMAAVGRPSRPFAARRPEAELTARPKA